MAEKAISDFIEVQKRIDSLKEMDILQYEAKALSIFRETRNIIKAYSEFLDKDFKLDLECKLPRKLGQSKVSFSVYKQK